MALETLVAARRMAEAAVEGMAEGPLRVAAFETILGKLLDVWSESGNGIDAREPGRRPPEKSRRKAATAPSGTTSRITSLVDEEFFAVQRSLTEIQSALAERGWHYDQNYLSTPLTRLVRKRVLRRTQVANGAKKFWMYSVY